MNKCASKSCGCSDTPVVTVPTPVSPQRQQAGYRIDTSDCRTEEALIRHRLAQLAGIHRLDLNPMQRTLAANHMLPSLEPLEAALAGIDMNARQINGDSTHVTEMIDIIEVQP